MIGNISENVLKGTIRPNIQINGNISGNEELEARAEGNFVRITDKNYVYNQTEATDTWVVVHNLGKYPAVTIIDSSGAEVIGDIYYDNLNQVTITFVGAFKGTATFN